MVLSIVKVACVSLTVCCGLSACIADTPPTAAITLNQTNTDQLIATPCQTLYPPQAFVPSSQLPAQLHDLALAHGWQYRLHDTGSKDSQRWQLYFNQVALWPNYLLYQVAQQQLIADSHQLYQQLRQQTPPPFIHAAVPTAPKPDANAVLIDHCAIYSLIDQQLQAIWLLNYRKGLQGYSVWINDADGHAIKRQTLSPTQ